MVSNNSPYLGAFGLKYEGGDVSLERVPYVHILTDDDVEHIVMEGETIFSIAYKYYGDSGMWYMITDYNNIVNPIDDVIPGLQITIPYGR